MPKQKITTNTVNPVHHFRKMDEKIKLLIGLGLGLLAILVFLKTPFARDTLGINIAGLSSDASYGRDDMSENTKQVEFYGKPEVDCSSATGCEDSRLKMTSPEPDERIITRSVNNIAWEADESVEARFHQISVQAICTDTEECPEPYIIANKYRGNSPYKWQIGSFLPVPQNLQNRPVWIRVTTQGLYRDGAPANYYTQVPVVLSQFR